MRELWELQQMQSLPLDAKIQMTRSRVDKWIETFGEDGVYISFSGGKDSTVLLDLVRNEFGYKNVRAMFVDVPTQYPELRQFVKTFDNVDIVTPKINFFQVCEKYGFPLFSKEISECINGARKYLINIFGQELGGVENINEIKAIVEEKPELLEKSLRENFKKKGEVMRTAKMLGWWTKENTIDRNANWKNRSMMNYESYKFMIFAPFECASYCCNAMKKEPANRYAKETKSVPITAQMASESKMRTRVWIRQGCNAFDAVHPISNPMSFWTEQDVLLYIRIRNLPICSVYGDVVTDDEEMGQMQLSDFAGMEIFDQGQQCLHCTGCKRTGCVLCGFGTHLPNEQERFTDLRKTHPKMYALLDVCKNNGYTMRQAIDWISENSTKVIRY